MICFKISALKKAMAPQAGKVKIQAKTISRDTPQRTALTRRAAPTPIMEVVMVWVVLKGMPNCDAPKIFKAVAIKTARRGEITRVDTTVAMALGASVQPFTNSA